MKNEENFRTEELLSCGGNSRGRKGYRIYGGIIKELKEVNFCSKSMDYKMQVAASTTHNHQSANQQSTNRHSKYQSLAIFFIAISSNFYQFTLSF